MSLNQQIDAHKVRSGWLYKKGWYNTSWKKRFFVLYDDRIIFYYAKESHATNRCKAKGKIHLTQIRRVELVSYHDPNNKNSSPHSSMSMLYRKSSLPMHLSRSYGCSTQSTTRTKDQQQQQFQQQHGALRKAQSYNYASQSSPPRSPNFLTTFSYNTVPPPPMRCIQSPVITPQSTHCRRPKNSKSKSKSKSKSTTNSESKTPTNTKSKSKSFNWKQPTPQKERASSVHYPLTSKRSNSPSNSTNMSPLQSINEKQSVEAVISLKPYIMDTDYFSADKARPIGGVNGWSFNGMNGMDDMTDFLSYGYNEYNTPSNIVSSTQPPPDYNQIIQNEQKFAQQRQELDKSLLALTNHTYSHTQPRDKKPTKNDTNNKENISRPPVPITRRSRTRDCNRNRTQSAGSNMEITHHNTYTYIQPSITTTFQALKPRSDSNTSTCTQNSESIQLSEGSLTPYHSSVETVECAVTDDDDEDDVIHSSASISSDYMAGFGGRNNYNKDVILSTEIRRSHGASDDDNMSYDLSESKQDEFDIFQTVMDDTRLGLSCNKRYSFSLIHPNREYILAAETNQELKEWISIFSKLVQGKPIYSGYLALKHAKKSHIWNKKFFILFENKVLNYYKYHVDVNNGNACEFDIDLRHVMWLRYCSKNEFNIDLKQHFCADEIVPCAAGDNNSYYLPAQTAYFNTPSGNSVINPLSLSIAPRKKRHSSSIYSLEIAIPNRIFILTAETQRIRNEWYNKIRSVFSDTLILKRYFDSAVANIYFVHNQSNFRNRYIALFKDMLVVFNNQKKLDTIKRMTFFDETRFRDYIRKEHCTIIPINLSVKVRKASSCKYGDFAFVVHNNYDDRKWYINCSKKEDLEQWIYLLVDKRRLINKRVRKKCGQSKNNLVPPQAQTKKRHKKHKQKHKECDIEVESTLNNNEINETRTSVKRFELRDNTSVTSTATEVADNIPENYDLSLVSSKESPVPDGNISVHVSSRNIVAQSTKRYMRVTEKCNDHIKLVRSHSDDFTDDFRQYVAERSPVYKHKYDKYQRGKIQKKPRSVSVDGHELSPKNKLKGRHVPNNIDLDKMLRK